MLLLKRLQAERHLIRRSGHFSVIGVDEVGRGPLAGPVVAAAVSIFRPENIAESDNLLLRDSKTLSPKQRAVLYHVLRKSCIVCVAQASVAEIDRDNILNATLHAMSRAVNGCKHPALRNPYALIDGNRTPALDIPCQSIVRGDQHCVSIATASIVAKVIRDRLMRRYHQEYPHYGWNRNVGYGTPEHLEALKHYGATPHHRRSFRPVSAVLYIS